jgi:hypothetical protein
MSTCSISPSKGIVYYTDNHCDEKILKLAQEYLLRVIDGKRIVSVSLTPLNFGDNNIVLPLERGYKTMFKQILAGIELLDTEIIFLAEHDVLYTKEHFDFIPPTKDLFYYNMNNWQVRISDGHACYFTCKKVSQLSGYRDIFLKHYRERCRRLETEPYTFRMGFEPGSNDNRPERVDKIRSEGWSSKMPNLDLRHDLNLSATRWKPEEFRNPCKVSWKDSHVNSLPGWEDLRF